MTTEHASNLVRLAFWVSTAITFGAWQHSVAAGLFAFFVIDVIATIFKGE